MTKHSIDFTKSAQYILSIRLSTDGFSFSIHNPSQPEEFHFQTYPVNTLRSMAANVKTFLSNTEILSHCFKETNILVHGIRYTTVPLELFEDEYTESIFYQNLPKQSNEIVLCNILGNSNSVVLFSIDKLTHLLLSEQFPNARFFCSASPQIEYLTTHAKAGKQAYINLNPGQTDVFCLTDQSLKLVNSFQTSHLNDRCYYILNIWKELEYDQEKDRLYLFGCPLATKEIKEILSEFIREIHSINPLSEYNLSAQSTQEYIPFDIQSLLTCV